MAVHQTLKKLLPQKLTLEAKCGAIAKGIKSSNQRISLAPRSWRPGDRAMNSSASATAPSVQTILVPEPLASADKSAGSSWIAGFSAAVYRQPHDDSDSSDRYYASCLTAEAFEDLV